MDNTKQALINHIGALKMEPIFGVTVEPGPVNPNDPAHVQVRQLETNAEVDAYKNALDGVRDVIIESDATTERMLNVISNLLITELLSLTDMNHNCDVLATARFRGRRLAAQDIQRLINMGRKLEREGK